jgi:hypothetical protein
MPDNLDIHQTTTRCAFALNQIQNASRSMRQLRENWPDRLDEYLRDEKYEEMTADDLTDGVVQVFDHISVPLKQLSDDLYSLSNDLIRVERGDGFRV